MTRWAIGSFFLLLFSCSTSQQHIRRMQEFRAAQSRGDTATASRYIAPDARMWFESKTGAGEPYTAGGGSWKQWDEYFGSRTTMTKWRAERNSVSAEGVEMNDFMRLLEWEPRPWTITWWLDEDGRIKEVLLKGNPGKPKSRMEEFKAWARANRPDELKYLMPKDRIDPTADRPERWRAILIEWRKSAGLPVL